MAGWTKMCIFVYVIVLCAALVSCQIHMPDSSYSNLSKSVRKFLDLLAEESSQNEESNWFNTVDREDVSPKVRLLAHVIKFLTDSPDVISRFSDSTNNNILDPLTSEDSIYYDHSENDEDKTEKSLQGFLPDNEFYYPDQYKRNGFWYGKRRKRNGFWYGKRSSEIPSLNKRNGFWYGKRNGFWYGKRSEETPSLNKRNGFWYGKRSTGSYPRQDNEVI